MLLNLSQQLNRFSLVVAVADRLLPALSAVLFMGTSAVWESVEYIFFSFKLIRFCRKENTEKIY